MNKRVRRERNRLRRIEFLASLTLVFSIVATGYAIVPAAAPGVTHGTEKPQPQQEVRQEETPPAEPEKEVEKKPAVLVTLEMPPANLQETKAPQEEAEAPEVQEEQEAPKPYRYEITVEELDIVARVVQAEAGGEGYDGQVLVAQCILNTAEATGRRPDEVVLEPGQYTTPAALASDEVKQAVAAVFLDGYQVTEEPVRYFYAPAYCVSTWHETALDFVLEYGGHRFFKARQPA